MNNTLFNDRIEKKYQIGITESEVAGLWRDLSSFLGPHGLVPVQEITSVGSVYFDNKNCDLLRYCLFGRLLLVRLRNYEIYDRPPDPITEYWVEVKTAQGDRRNKRRFRLPKTSLQEFLQGIDVRDNVLGCNRYDIDENVTRELYREAQETILTLGLQPMLLVVYKRIAFQSELERLSIDWDLKHYYVSTDAYDNSSWKYLAEAPAGKSDNIILEMKYLQSGIPPWFDELQRRYPIRQREYLKPVEGMGFLFDGPLKYHEKANLFRPLITAYMSNSQLG